MKSRFKIPVRVPISCRILAAVVSGFVFMEKITAQPAMDSTANLLWYRTPAEQWIQALPEARRLVFAGDYAAADKFISVKMQGNPRGQCAYQPIADLTLDFPGEPAVTNYRRELNIDTAVPPVHYARGRVNFTREIFSSGIEPAAKTANLRHTGSVITVHLSDHGDPRTPARPRKTSSAE